MKGNMSGLGDKMVNKIIVGIVIAIVISAVASLFAAGLVLNQMADERSLDIIGGISRFVAVLIGVLSAAGGVIHKRYIIGAAVSVIYFLILVITNMLLGNEGFSGLLIGAITIVAGGGIGTALRRKNDVIRRKYMVHSR